MVFTPEFLTVRKFIPFLIYLRQNKYWKSVLVVCLTELPKPQLGEPRDLRALRMQPAQEDVLTVSQTLDKLLALDTVQVELIPEKKGLFLKHVEYQVTSQARDPINPTARKCLCQNNLNCKKSSKCGAVFLSYPLF